SMRCAFIAGLLAWATLGCNLAFEERQVELDLGDSLVDVVPDSGDVPVDQPADVADIAPDVAPDLPDPPDVVDMDIPDDGDGDGVRPDDGRHPARRDRRDARRRLDH